jgi:WD40 repeat protein
MALFRQGLVVALGLLLGAATGGAAEQLAPTPGLYDRPVLVVDLGLHTTVIMRAAADAAGRWAVTGSADKTVRVWSLADGTLARTIRLPSGPGDIGMVLAVAISPDGALIAAGGWTRASDADRQEQIYLFDRASGAMARPPIAGLPNVVLHLVFSRDGALLAATLGSGGLRLYARAQNWEEVARDTDYDGLSYGADFAPDGRDGRLATTAFDGMLRLYVGPLAGEMRPATPIDAPGGHQPYGIAFSPDGARLAVGYNDSTEISLLDGQTLAILPKPDLAGIDNGNLANVTWSRDSATLFAGGEYHVGAGSPVLAWSNGGAGPRRTLPAGSQALFSLVPLPDGDLLAAAADPWLGRIGADGTRRWSQPPPQADFRAQYNTLAVSADGTVVDFGFAEFGEVPARLDLAARSLLPDPPSDRLTARPRQDGLPVQAWVNDEHPTFDGRPIPLYPYEFSQSMAIAPHADQFVLGTEGWLRAFDARGTPLWNRPAPGTVWAVNVTGDGRLVVAAYGDGTIRWHRMSDGAELLAFMPLANKTDWVAWTPEGFYAATAGAHGVLRWHINHGWEQAAEAIPVNTRLVPPGGAAAGIAGAGDAACPRPRRTGAPQS